MYMPPVPIEDKPDLSHVKMFLEELLNDVLYQKFDDGYDVVIYALDGTPEQLENAYALIRKYFEGM